MDKLRNLAYRFLRWTEKYTKTDMIYVASGGFWLVAGQVMLTLLGFCSAWVFANYLPAELYGNFRYILSVTAIIGTLSLSGIGTAVSRSVAHDHEGSLPIAFRASFKWGWVMVVAGAIGAIYYFLQHNAVLAFGMLLAGAANPFFVSCSLHDSFLEGKKWFKRKMWLSLIRNVAPVLGVTLIVLLTDNLFLILGAYFILNAATAFAIYRYVVAKYVTNNESDDDVMHYGIHLSAVNLISTINTNIDRIILFQFIGATPLAIFSFAQAPLNYVQVGFQMVKTMLFPKFAERSVREIKRGAGRKVLLLTVVSVVATAAHILIAPVFFHTFFPAYTESIPITQILALTTLTIPTIVFSQAFLAHKKQNQMYILRIIGLASKVLALVILMPLYGVWGVAWAAVISKGLETLTLIYLFIRLPDDEPLQGSAIV